MDNFSETIEQIRLALEEKNAVRDAMIGLSRVLTRHCGNSIRAMHRQEWENAQVLLQTAREVLENIRRDVARYPDLYFAGYTQDSFKEFVEASLTYAMVRDEALPTPQELRVEESTYLNGMAEAASELRRYILDIIRRDHSDQAERLLEKMETVYDTLVTFDFPDVISGGLRHRTDQVRGVLERTRGDVTMSIRQQRLESALARTESSKMLPRLDNPGNAV